MKRRTTTDFEIAVMSRLDAIEQRQNTPRVNDRWSGLVASAPEAIAGVSIALASVPISMVGAGAGAALKMSPDACLQIGGLICGAGASFGVLCLGAGAVDLVEIVDNLSERYFAYRERRDERKVAEQNSIREVPVFTRGEQAGYLSIPEPTEFKVKTLKIPSVNVAGGVREISVDKVCSFLKSAVASGNWSRETQAVLNTKEHPDVKAYLKGRGFWKLDPPTLRRACVILRGGGTNGTGRDGTDGRTV